MKRISVIFFVLVFTLPSLVLADRGLVPISPEVSVREPGQKAIVAWDGQEEILILSTDVISSQDILVLEILPLPSIPVVEAASFQAFDRIQEMIWEESVNQNLYSDRDNARSNSVEILFHEQIGAHNITVVMATETDDLNNLAYEFLLASGVTEQMSLQNFQAAVDEYMGMGFKYYVLDYVTFRSQERSVEPILYRFNSSTMYYPLLITSPVGGDGKITLFTLTNEKVEGNSFWPLQLAYYQLPDRPSQPIQFTLSRGDLSKVDLRIGELFPEGAWLSVARFEGNLGSLTKDLMLTEESFNPSAGSTTTFVVTFPYDLIVLCFLLGAVSALAGVAVAFLIGRLTRRK